MQAREIELQLMALKVSNKAIDEIEKDIKSIKTRMELTYYLKQITNRIEILSGMKFDL